VSYSILLTAMDPSRRPLCHPEGELHKHQCCAGKLKYCDHQWLICTDFKMLNFLLGQQQVQKPVLHAARIVQPTASIGWEENDHIAIKK